MIHVVTNTYTTTILPNTTASTHVPAASTGTVSTTTAAPPAYGGGGGSWWTAFFGGGGGRRPRLRRGRRRLLLRCRLGGDGEGRGCGCRCWLVGRGVVKVVEGEKHVGKRRAASWLGMSWFFYVFSSLGFRACFATLGRRKAFWEGGFVYLGNVTTPATREKL